LLLRGTFAINQTRTLIQNEKTYIKYKPLPINPLFNHFNTLSSLSPVCNKSWALINKQKDFSKSQLDKKKVVIYSYSLSYNLLREIILKLKVNVTLTKEIKKASLIIGLKKHLQQNQKLQLIAKQKNIPIYGINRSSIYQITKLFQFIML